MSKFSKLASALLCVSLCCSSLGAKTIVKVDDVDISDSIFEPLKQQNPSFNYDALPEAQKNQLLDEIINSVVAANAAKKDGMDKSEEFKVMTIQSLAQLWFKRQVDSLSKTVSVPVSEAQTYYNNNKELFVTQDADFRHILVSKEDQAKNLIAEIGKVPKTKTEDKIAELAKKYSIDESSKQNGGLIEHLSIKNNPQIDRDFAQEISKMSIGTYTKTPIKTRYGYHIVYLKKLDKPNTQSFEQIKDQLVELLKQQKMQQIIQEKIKKLRDTSKITYGSK